MPRATTNEIRGRFISALRLQNLTKSEWRLIVALNDLYNPEFGKAWASQIYLSEAIGLPIRTIYKATQGLVQKGIIWTDTVRLYYHLSRLEYRIQYNKIISCDPGYPKRATRPRIDMTPAQTETTTGTNGGDYRHKRAQLPAQTCHQSSLVPSLVNPLENSLGNKSSNLNLEGREASKRNSREEESDEANLLRYRRLARGE